MKIDKLEKNNLYLTLYSYYKNLFTSIQKEYFELYFYMDMSLSEISIEKNVSRNAVFLQLKKICQKLDEYENKLSLNKKNLELLKEIKKIEKEKNIDLEILRKWCE